MSGIQDGGWMMRGGGGRGFGITPMNLGYAKHLHLRLNVRFKCHFSPHHCCWNSGIVMNLHNTHLSQVSPKDIQTY